jgi:hypothetical protein
MDEVVLIKSLMMSFKVTGKIFSSIFAKASLLSGLCLLDSQEPRSKGHEGNRIRAALTNERNLSGNSGLSRQKYVISKREQTVLRPETTVARTRLITPER